MEVILDWPLRDIFLAYVDQLKETARQNYQTDTIVWAILAPHQKSPKKPPAVPKILR